jgi:hypothetical protein
LTESEQKVEETIQGDSAATIQASLELDQISRKARDGTPLTEREQARRKALQDQLLVARTQFQRFLTELPRTLRAPIRELRAVNEGQLDGLRKILRQRPGTAIVHYVMGPERLSIVLTLPGINLSFQRPVSDVALHRRIFEFRQVLTSRGNLRVAAQRLYEDLVRPNRDGAFCGWYRHPAAVA